MVKEYMSLGLGRSTCLKISGLTKSQLYYSPKPTKQGPRPSTVTRLRGSSGEKTSEVSNNLVINRIIALKIIPDQPDGYRLLTMNLQLEGYFINHKKVYRLMRDHHLLESPRRSSGRDFVKFRRVAPQGPLSVLEMDIKYFYVEQRRGYAFVLTIIDTFTRVVLNWRAGYSIRQEQVKQLWSDVIVNYLQPANLLGRRLDIEIRNDNGKQFSADSVRAFFAENKINQVFTHPYTPEENAHVESFHKTLGTALSKDNFYDLDELEKRLSTFYLNYNQNRPHGSTVGVPPTKFWALCEDGKIKVEHLEKRRIKFTLLIPRQEVLSHPNVGRYDNRANEPKGSSWLPVEALEGLPPAKEKQRDRASTEARSQQPSV